MAEHRSRALPDVLRDINKPSDNPLTRSLYLTLGALAPNGDATVTSAMRGDFRVSSVTRAEFLSLVHGHH